MRFTRSASRSVLGLMNDLRFQIAVDVAHVGGFGPVDWGELHRQLNRTPLSAVGYRYPVEGLSDGLAEGGAEGPGVRVQHR